MPGRSHLRADGHGERDARGHESDRRRSPAPMPRAHPERDADQARERVRGGVEEDGTPLKCESVPLYQGGQYWLYKYKRYDDVRLAFAPEQAVAAFGGDPDNFQFPRWCLDMSLLRAYENGKPAATPAHLTIQLGGRDDGEPVFVAGPSRHDAAAADRRAAEDRARPRPSLLAAALFASCAAGCIQFSQVVARGGAHRPRTISTPSRTASRSVACSSSRCSTIALMDQIRRRKQAARARRRRGAREPRRQRRGTTSPRRMPRRRDIYHPVRLARRRRRVQQRSFAYARSSCARPTERAKPNGERLREYTDGACRRCGRARRRRRRPIPSSSRCPLSFSLERMREWLGPDHADREGRRSDTPSPDERAKALVGGSKLARCQGAAGALRRRPGSGGGQHRPDDPAGARDRRRGARAAEDLRDGGRRPGPARAAGDRRGAVQGVRHDSSTRTRRSRSAVTMARSKAGTRRARRSIRSPGWTGCTSAPPARRRSRCRSAGSTPNAHSICRRPRQLRRPPTTSSAATPAARW